MKKLIEQMFKFGIVGIISFIIDYGVFFILNEKLGIYYLVANVCSFSVSVVINYILNLKYVFQSSDNANKAKEFVIYIILNIIGLGFNQLIMKVCVGYLEIHPMIAKIIATGVVMIYNFISRKLLIEKIRTNGGEHDNKNSAEEIRENN